MLLTIFPAKEARKSPSKLHRKFATNFAEKLRQLHSGNRWCLKLERKADDFGRECRVSIFGGHETLKKEGSKI